MRALYFPFIPADAEAHKTLRPAQFTIMGSTVYLSGLFQALLRHSTYDRIVLPACAPSPHTDLRDTELFAQNRARIAFTAEADLPQLAAYDSCAFLTWSPDLGSLTRVRRLSRCRIASITGMIHALHFSWQLHEMLSLLFAPLTSHDALVCSSTAGRTTVLNFVDLLGDRLAQLGWPKLEARFQTPVIPLGIDTDQYAAADEGTLRSTLDIGDGSVVLYFGRFSSASKADLLPLILACADLHAARQPTLVLAGDDTQFGLAATLRQFASEVAPSVRLRVVPNPDVQTKRQLYALADIFVSPSDSLQETFGLTVVEAMAAGLPTVVSDWDGYKDLVVEGETGFRVRTTLPIYDARFDDMRGAATMVSADLLAATTIVSVEGLRRALATLVKDDDRRRAMGDAARQRARTFYDWRTVIASYEALWEQLADDARRAGEVAERRLDASQFGYREIFAHYPTDFLAPADELRLTALGRSWSTHAAWTARTVAGALAFETALFESMLTRLDGHAMTVSALLDGVATAAEGDLIVATAHLCRLLKYGLIERMPHGACPERETES
jgi:glycosyltransferase involved in cell wall biosynthesis